MTSIGRPSFDGFRPEHRERLKRLVQTPEWSELLARRDALERWKSRVRVPPPVPGQQSKANEYLREKNAERVLGLLPTADDEELTATLGDWETALAGDDAFPVVFLGLVVTLDCSFLPRCIYCNQLWLPRKLTLDDWKAIIEEVAEPVAPYVYLTGGEPLILGAEIWGDSGLVAFATDRGCAVNINTNATLIGPHVALNLVKAGTAKLHISLDAHDAETQEGLLGAPDRWGAVVKGLFNIHVAREVLGTGHPEVHLNCVLTSRNLFQVPDLLRFLLEIRPEGSSGGENAIHLIPVGGPENDLLRPTAAEWKRFYTETWAEAEEVWRDHQAGLGVPAEDRLTLNDAFPFMSPYHRARHDIDLDEYCERAARGEYWQGALLDRCYVAPTQAFVLPDGSQHWCGAHAIRRPAPLGNVLDAGIRENIRANIAAFSELPSDDCHGCAGATCVINQAAERNLAAQIGDWRAHHSSGP